MYRHLIRFIRDWYGTDAFIPLHEPRFFDTDRRYVVDAIDSTFVSSVGEYVNRFEEKLAARVGAGYAVVTVNGTAALQVALRLAGVEPGHEVVTQPLTFVATANAIVYNGAHPVFVDVDTDTLGMSPESLERFLDRNVERKQDGCVNKTTGRKIKAIVPMHTFGHPCKMAGILELAEHWHLSVVEDAAEALGSVCSGRQCGTLGRLGVFSFNGNKIITCGGGGAIVTDDEGLAKKARHLTTTAKVSHPWAFVHDDVGYNFRMPNLNAALACAQLERLDVFLQDKRSLAEAYADFFEKENWAVVVKEPAGCQSNHWLNAVLTSGEKQRDELLQTTNAAGIMTRPAWQLMTDLPMFKDCGKESPDNARRLVQRIVNLPSSVRTDV